MPPSNESALDALSSHSAPQTVGQLHPALEGPHSERGGPLFNRGRRTSFDRLVVSRRAACGAVWFGRAGGHGAGARRAAWSGWRRQWCPSPGGCGRRRDDASATRCTAYREIGLRGFELASCPVSSRQGQDRQRVGMRDRDVYVHDVTALFGSVIGCSAGPPSHPTGHSECPRSEGWPTGPVTAGRGVAGRCSPPATPGCRWRSRADRPGDGLLRARTSATGSW
jgi:hypothetical protein